MDRIYAYAVIFALIGAVASPLLRHPRDDGFPLSTYPMFSDRRPELFTSAQVLAVLDDGSRRIVPPEVITNSEVLQTNAAIWRAINSGAAATKRLCERVARAVPSYAPRTVVSIEVARSTFNAVKYFEGQTKPLRSNVYARCWPPAKRAAR